MLPAVPAVVEALPEASASVSNPPDWLECSWWSIGSDRKLPRVEAYEADELVAFDPSWAEVK